MNRSKPLLTVLAGLTLIGIMLTGCGNNTPEPTPVDDETKTAVADAYTALVDETYNHNQTTDSLDKLSTEVGVALGDDGTDYEAALKLLTPVVPMAYVYVPTDSPADKIANIMRVFNIMLTNTINDKVTVTVDPDKIVLNETGDVATIPYLAVVFSSEQNDTTGLANLLNNQYSSAPANTGVQLHLTDNGWKVDMFTFLPGIPTSSETPENTSGE